MSSILNNSVSGLLTFQRSIATTSHNIANSSTPGFSRQRVILATQPGQAFGFGYIGHGVRTDSIERVQDQFVESRLRSAITDDGRTRMYAELAGQLDNLLASEQSGLSSAVGDYFSSVQNLANDPSSTISRQLMLSEAAVLVDRFNFMEGELAAVGGETNVRVTALVGDINALAADIASINADIVQGSNGNTTSGPNDLYDLRDLRIKELAALVGITTLPQENGALNVFSSSGQALVVGVTTQQWGTTPDAADPTILQVADATGAAISDKLSGGEVGGLLDFRRETFDTARNELGRIATVLADTLNAQHRKGLDANGNLGQDLFTIATPQPNANLNNVGTAVASAAITDTSALTTSDYQVDFDGANFTMTRLSDGVNVTGAGPLLLDGVQVSFTAGAVAGDRFLVRPVAQGAKSIALAFSDPDLIAAAAPVRAGSISANTGDGVVAQPVVVDETNPALTNTVEIVFNTPANTFDVVDITAGSTLAAGVAYTPGAAISANGWTSSVAGAPVAGDRFRIELNAGGFGDNRNMLAMGELQTASTVENSLSYQEAYSTFVGRAGIAARSAQLNASAREQILEDVTLEREAVSGVSLDEEAVDLTRLQQAYQAMATMVQTSNSLFDSILAAVR